MDIQINTDNIVIETECLLLRGFRETDLADMYEYASVPGVGEMAGWPHHESIETSAYILRRFMEHKEVLAIVHKAEGKVIGSLGIHASWANEEDAYKHLKVKEIGYVLAKPYWGQGLMPEAVCAVIAYGFEKLGLEGFTCGHFAHNAQSRRVIEKCGFRFVRESEYYAEQLDETVADKKYILLKEGPLAAYYSNYDEDGRLLRQYGQVEYLTTLRYIERYLSQDAKVLEIGAGTGRYSRALADMGYAVEAVELIEHNIEIFKAHVKPGQNIRIMQGNALDLSVFSDNSFDVVLLLGPMYHLFTKDAKQRALVEALRVTKSGGVLFVAYCLSDASIVESGFRRKAFDMADYIRRGKINPVTFDTTSEPEDIFELVRREDIDRLIEGLPLTRLHYVATDLFTNYMREMFADMDDEAFALYLRYHYAVCERADMVGISHHVLDVLRKEGNNDK